MGCNSTLMQLTAQLKLFMAMLICSAFVLCQYFMYMTNVFSFFCSCQALEVVCVTKRYKIELFCVGYAVW